MIRLKSVKEAIRDINVLGEDLDLYDEKKVFIGVSNYFGFCIFKLNDTYMSKRNFYEYFGIDYDEEYKNGFKYNEEIIAHKVEKNIDKFMKEVNILFLGNYHDDEEYSEIEVKTSEITKYVKKNDSFINFIFKVCETFYDIPNIKLKYLFD